MITVRLYAATEEKSVHFRQVHRDDGGRISIRRFCDSCHKEVAFDDIGKGYEHDDGQIVPVSEEDLASLPLPSMRTIEVMKFVRAEEIDPILYNRTYFIKPDDVAVTPYTLLREALRTSGRVAVARVALRQVERLAAIRVRDDMLVLHTMLWPDELRTPNLGSAAATSRVRPAELAMTTSLIDSMTDHLDPDELRDGYRAALLELIHAKSPASPSVEAGDRTATAAGPAEALQRGRVARTA
ncbi:Ku protein [Micromonospora fulviviridis]|uniref:non-homologous end joining protein Ku n=1 Tax=Micromonospora fulviviridis TaxID=47860 RepID=UPI00379594B5